MLKSITLKNWRSHDNSTIQFAKGTNIIIGRMGGGKSSVIDAICFALFGTCPAIQQRRLKVTDFIRNRPDEQTQSEVTLIFDHKNNEYTITRKLKRKGSSEAEIKKNGERMEGPQSERVTDYIKNLIEIDYDLFTRAIYSEQNRIDYFLTLRSGERKRQIDELIGIDRFETVRKNATTAISRLKTMCADKESFMKNIDPDKMKREINEHNAKVSELSKEKIETESSLASSEKRKNEIDLELSTVSKERENHRKLSEEKTGLQHTLSVLKKDVESAPVIGDLEKTRARMESIFSSKSSLQKELDLLEASYRNVSSSVGKIQAEEQETRRKLQKKEELTSKKKSLLENRKIDDIRNEFTELEKKNSEAIDLLAKEMAELSQLENAVKELMKGTAKCPVCDSDLTDNKRNELLKNKNDAITKTHVGVKDTKTTIEQNRKSIQALKDLSDNARRVNDLLEQYAGVEELLKESSVKSESIKKELESIRVKREEISRQVNSASNEYLELAKVLERIMEIDKKGKKIAEINIRLHTLETDLGRLKFDDKVWDELNKQLKDVMVTRAEIKGKREKIMEGERYLSELINDKTKRLKETEEYSKDVKTYRSVVEELQVFSNAIIETQYALREELIDAVNQAISEVWIAVYPYSDYTSIKLQPSESDYDLVFKINDEFVSVDGVASGGERALACLALRIAFAMVLTPNLSWLILDEPTHNLDEEAVKTLAETLREQIPRIVEQTFVITHDENMKDAASGKLFRIQRNSQRPEISEVEELHDVVSLTPSIN